MTEFSPVTYTARVDIPRDHPCFPGHFPGQPILPGVLLLERVMALARDSLACPLDECTLHNIKFLAPVAPGDLLEVQLATTNPGDYKFTVRVFPGQSGDAVIACSGHLRVASP